MTLDLVASNNSAMPQLLEIPSAYLSGSATQLLNWILLMFNL